MSENSSYDDNGVMNNSNFIKEYHAKSAKP
jgi:hypothetical protein